MLKSFKYRAYPIAEQKQIIDQTIETCRRWYNAMLDERIMVYQQTGKTINRISQQNRLPAIKNVNEFYVKVYAQVLVQVTFRIDRAYQNFFRRVKENKEKAGFPRFKGKQFFDSFCYPQSGFKLQDNMLSLSKIGNIKIKLHRSIEGKIKTCTVIRKNGKYYVCFSCEVEENLLPKTGKQVGIDVGIADHVITSDNEFFSKVDVYRKAEKRLKYLQRMASRRKKGSNRRRKAVIMLAKQHEKVANQRKDIAHKTARKLINEYDLIAHEDLNVKGMVKNHNLAKSINDAAWHKLFECLVAKASDAGRMIVKVPPAYTSQICSCCGELVPKKLSERWHKCPKCGLKMQRDVNAAKNILNIALSSIGNTAKMA